MFHTQKVALTMTTGVTLDGEPARINGYNLDFPVVRTMDGARSAEFAWETVAHVVANKGGAFRS